MPKCGDRSPRAGLAWWWVVGAFCLACGAPEDHGFFQTPAAAGSGGTSAGAGGSGIGGDAGGGTAGGGAAGAAGSASGSAGTPGGTSGGAGVAGSAGGGGAGNGGAAGTLAGSGAEAGDAGGAGEAPVSCEPFGGRAEAFDGHCYLYRSEDSTWDEAVDDCEGRDGHLVTISSDGRSRAEFEAENAFVWQLADSTPVWIGATDGRGPLEPGNGTFFTWITGEPMTEDAWSPGQPNNSSTSCPENTPCSCDQGACYEHCGFLWATESADPVTLPGWNDRLCEHLIPHVCEWDDP